MATVKAVSSKQSIGGAIDYVCKEEKTESKLISGLNCQPETVKEEMQATKELWGKTDGRTYKHFTQNFHKDENITAEQAHAIAKEFAEQCPQFKGHEVLIATHEDKKHIHTHFIVNSVNFKDGHKFRMHKSELQEMKDLSDQICSQHGLHICEKGKTFEGAEREEVSAYTKETYQLLKKAEQSQQDKLNGLLKEGQPEVKSYVQDIALAVMDCREEATSRQEFCELMAERGYKTDWQDSHKYITFTDLAREQAGEKQCKIRHNKLEKYYNVDFGKESLERGFEVNARAKETTERAKEQLKSGTDRETIPENNGTGSSNADAFLRELHAKERASEEKRKDRDAQRERYNLAEKQRASERKPEAPSRETGSRPKSKSRGIER